ncbi:MAG TPA: tRNA (adenosine(37)-N6)-threonylcarbamoyltransferase complex ATPase subunit type 1 TsaE [Actinomycetaceae bacterium]|nr:tRNA (adenosine(37)-N6)-threonylcarbamoyltransferase complex ATPase subunit type 1 TsaE [Actinomycetaceae bacterium]
MTYTIATPEEMREFGRALSGLLAPGDLVLIHGSLGAGKTTLAQGIGEGLGVAGHISSPTFIIARSHQNPSCGPGLVHVDAYRLGSFDELDALDLDTSLGEAVTVVEWGEGIAEVLSDDRIEIEIDRPKGGLAADDTEVVDDAKRHLRVTVHGDRWRGVDLDPLGAWA